jgi:hypothetical protein
MQVLGMGWVIENYRVSGEWWTLALHRSFLSIILQFVKRVSFGLGEF